MSSNQGSGMPPLNFAGFVGKTEVDKLFYRNITPAPTEEFCMADMTGQTINLGYGIKSLDPTLTNLAIERGKVITKEVSFVQYVDCSLRSDSGEKWDVSNDYIKKTVKVVDNLDLYNNQIDVMETAVSNFLKKTVFPGGFASTTSSFDMNKYFVYFGTDGYSEKNLKSKVNTFFPLIRTMKTQFSEERLATIPLYEVATCNHVTWNRYNKIGIPDALISVGQIIRYPPVSGSVGVGYGRPITSVTNGSSPIDIGGESEDEVSVDVNAIIEQTYFNPVRTNIVSLLFTVYVDPFANSISSKDLIKVPHLLELNFLTTFYFDFDENNDKYNPALSCPPLEKPGDILRNQC